MLLLLFMCEKSLLPQSSLSFQCQQNAWILAVTPPLHIFSNSQWISSCLTALVYFNMVKMDEFLYVVEELGTWYWDQKQGISLSMWLRGTLFWECGLFMTRRNKQGRSYGGESVSENHRRILNKIMECNRMCSHLFLKRVKRTSLGVGKWETLQGKVLGTKRKNCSLILEVCRGKFSSKVSLLQMFKLSLICLYLCFPDYL